MNANDNTQDKPPMSELGQSLFDMLTAINHASAMQRHFEAMDRLDRPQSVEKD